MSSWQYLPAFQTGQILTAEAVNRLLANAEYLYALEAFGAPVFRVVNANAENTANAVVWSGYLRYAHRMIKDAIYVDTANVGGTGSYKLQIDTTGAGGWVDVYQRNTIAAATTYYDEHDITGSPTWDALTKGSIYKVRILASYCKLEILRVFTDTVLPTTKSGYVWQSMPNVSNGQVLTAADWNTYRNNLLYLRDVLAGPWTPVAEEQDTGAMSAVAWDQHGAAGNRNPPQTVVRGTVQHRSKYLATRHGGFPTDTSSLNGQYSRMTFNGYPIGTRSITNGDTKWQGDVETDGWVGGQGAAIGSQAKKVEDRVIDLTTSQNADGTANTNLTGLSRGTWYEVRLSRGVKSNDGQPISGSFNYVFQVQGDPDPTGWNALAPVNHGDDVAGGIGSKLDLLQANLNTLKARVDSFPSLVSWDVAKNKYFYHRSPILLWQGTNVDLYYVRARIPVSAGTVQQKVTLGTSPVPAAYDLRALPDLPFGAYLYVVNADFAFEVLPDG